MSKATKQRWAAANLVKEASGFTMRRVLMTPDLAKDLLAKLNQQRSLKPTRLKRYTEAMVAGEWDQENPQGCTTTIARDGGVLDSQHRLNAIVAAGATIPWTLIENVHPRARATMDVGGVWNPGDYLSSHGFLNANTVGAISKIVFSLGKTNYEAEPTRDELLKTARAYREDIEWAITLRAGSLAAAAFAWVRAEVASRKEDIERLGEQVKTGNECSVNGRHIRRVAGLERLHGDKKLSGAGPKRNTMVDRWAQTLLTLRLIECSLDGQQLTKLPFFKDRDQQSLLLRRLRAYDKKDGRGAT